MAKDRTTSKMRSASSKAKPPTQHRPVTHKETKQDHLIALLRRPGGATIDELVKATGWQRHTVRGAISATLRKRLGLSVTLGPNKKGVRVYRIAV